MSQDIEKIIKDVEREIAKTTDDAKREEQLERLQEAAKNYRGEDQLVSSADIVEQMKNRPEEKRMMTGYSGLDAILGGFRPKQLIVISAATKSGKTSFCVEITSRLAEENPAWLPFEEPAEELIQKFLDRGEQPPHFYTPERMTGNTLNWVEKKIIEAKAKFDSKIIFIDHLHFIVPFQSERQDLAIGHAMRELKRMAKTWNIIIVLIAHMKKSRVTEQPTLEDLRDSSFVAQEADTVIMLYRNAKRNNAGEIEITNEVNVSVQANRRTGKTGNIKMVYNDGRFVPTEWSRESEELWNSAGDDSVAG